MKYMLLIYEDDAERVANMDERMPNCAAYAEAMKKAGIYVGGERLRAISSATSVRVAGGKTHVVDGPYAEAKEQLGGFPRDRCARPRYRVRVGSAVPEAKSKIRHAGIPFQVPERAERGARLDAVLEAIYAAYAEGWSDPAGTEVRRRNLAEEGIWLGRLVASLLPDEPEALGLLSLMLYAQARRDAQGEYVPLADQDPVLWETALIEEAEGLLSRASAMPGTGRYQLEAAVQSAHAVRKLTGRSDWAAIEGIYDVLLAMTGSPVVAINRAIAITETRGPAAGLEALDALSDDSRLLNYQPYWAARAGLLARTGEVEAADAAYERAIGLEADPAVRRFLQRRRTELGGRPIAPTGSE